MDWNSQSISNASFASLICCLFCCSQSSENQLERSNNKTSVCFGNGGIRMTVAAETFFCPGGCGACHVQWKFPAVFTVWHHDHRSDGMFVNDWIACSSGENKRTTRNQRRSWMQPRTNEELCGEKAKEMKHHKN